MSTQDAHEDGRVDETLPSGNSTQNDSPLQNEVQHEQVSQIVEEKTSIGTDFPIVVTKLRQAKQWFKKGVLLLGAILLCVVAIFFIQKFVQNRSEQIPVKQFTSVYSFVPEKISMNAEIPITLPDGVDGATARAHITFSPEIRGTWVTQETPGVIVFKPDQPLREKVYYAVNMDAPGAQVSGDFYVDADPAILSIFPAVQSEANEKSTITIVFNRPMVSLTTLETVETKIVPITITPETKGKFKWISTRTLQFIPETTLVPSSVYTVTVGDGLTSVDGLAVPPFTHTFTTRPLRYGDLSQGSVGYRTPITILFNQAVDLEKTKQNIRVVRGDGTAIPVDVSYGQTTTYDWQTGRSTTAENIASLAVYPQRDSHNRAHFWDFDTDYTLTISGATTRAGTLPLTENRTISIHTPNIVESVTASSERTKLARANLFDPHGSLTLHFYDEIDKGRLDFTVPGIKSVSYGEHCKLNREGNQIQKGDGCEKEDDKRTLIFTFNPDAFTVGQVFTLELKRVYTIDGTQINSQSYPISLHVYPSFAITKTTPDSGSTAGSVNGMVVCSNSPLKELTGDESLKKYVTANNYIVYGRWSDSQYIEQNSTWYTGPCAQGEFETRLNYGLLPSTSYTVNLSLADPFGQTASAERSFVTEPPKSNYTRLHNLQQQYNVTRPGRTKLTYAAENLESVHVHICKMSPEHFLERTVRTYGPDDAPSDSECAEVARDTIVLPPRYWVNNYFQIDLQKYFPNVRGQYVVTLGSPLYIDEYSKNPTYDHTLVSVTDLAVGKKEVQYYENNLWAQSTNPATYNVLKEQMKQTGNLYWVNDSTTLAPSVGATVAQYTMSGSSHSTLTEAVTGTTDGQGVARVAVGDNVVGAVIRSGPDTAVVADWADTLNQAGGTESASRTYLYTDRPIYRPGQTVYLRGIDRIGFDGSYEVWTKNPVLLTVYDALDHKVFDTTLIVSTYGTFTSSFDLPQNAPLGTYRINAFGQDTYVSVEEYVPAAFKVETKTAKDEYINGDTVNLGVQADYYFGVPLSGGTVSYSITAQDYYFDRYTDRYFNFGADWYSCYSCGYGDSFITRGEATLDEKGHTDISRKFKLQDYFASTETVGSKLVTVSITVKDRNGRSVSTQQSFIVHRGSYYLGAQTSDYYTGVNTPITLRVKSVDTAGKPISVDGITRLVYKINWDTFKRQEVDGGFYYRSEKKRTEVSREKVKTDGDGNWSGPITLSEAGEYEVDISGTDNAGNKIQTTIALYIYGDATVYVPPNNNYSLDLVADRTNVAVGDTASVLIKSPYPHAKVLIAAERGTVYDYWVADVNGGFYKHTFPIKEGYAPNVTISALLLSGDPEVKFGSIDFRVGSTAHLLKVTVIPNKTEYLPGEAVDLTIHTTDAADKGTPAEVSVAVADLSVLALMGNPKKNPLVYFYDGFPLSVTTGSNIKNILYESEIPLGTKGGGGGDPEDLAKKQRGVFKDTAYWNATLETNADGNGEAHFTLPDNLTTWRIESLGLTKDTKLGVNYTEITTKKKLMATPLKPRFVVPGDTFSLGAQVFNESDANETIKILLTSDTLTLLGGHETTLTINKGDSKTVYFPVQAPKEMRMGVHTFTITAESNKGVDRVKQEIPITQNTVYETTATASFTKDNVATEYLYIPKNVVSDEGGLTVNANATLAVFTLDALTYMAQYPYGCSEQIASALSTIAMVKRALTVPGVQGDLDSIQDAQGVSHTIKDVVDSGLARIYESQTTGGGFAYYKGLGPNLYLTIRIVLALDELKKAGFTVRDDVMTRALTYIETYAMQEYRNTYPTGTESLILGEYVLRMVGGRTSTNLTPTVISFMQDDALLHEKLGNMSLAYLAIMTATGFDKKDADRVYTALTNRIDIDGRGAYLKNPNGTSYGYFETPIADTALLLRAFVAHRDENAMLGNVLRTLLKSRDRDGVWGSTQNTFMVVTALVEYLTWQHETGAQFSLRALLNNVEVFAKKFTPQNIFNTVTTFIPMKDLKQGTLLPLTFERTNDTGTKTNFYYDLALRYYLPADQVPPRDEGITITRALYALTDTKDEHPIRGSKVGDVLRGKITVTVPSQYRDIAIADSIPAGFEIVNFNLATEDQSLQNSGKGDSSAPGGLGYTAPVNNSHGFVLTMLNHVRSFFGGVQTAQISSWDTFTTNGSAGKSMTLIPTHVESHDDRVFLFVDSIAPGVYEYTYYLRALVPGEFQHLPAHAEELYFPEVFGRTDGDTITVTEK